MKQIRALVCTALIALTMGSEAHAAAWFQAKGAIAHDQKFRDRNQGNSGGDRDSGRGRGGDGRQSWNDGGWDENRNDDRASRAKDAVRGKGGRVLDVGQESGSIFWVKVSTDHGVVTYLVNADTGRIIGER